MPSPNILALGASISDSLARLRDCFRISGANGHPLSAIPSPVPKDGAFYALLPVTEDLPSYSRSNLAGLPNDILVHILEECDAPSLIALIASFRRARSLFYTYQVTIVHRVLSRRYPAICPDFMDLGEDKPLVTRGGRKFIGCGNLRKLSLYGVIIVLTSVCIVHHWVHKMGIHHHPPLTIHPTAAIAYELPLRLQLLLNLAVISDLKPRAYFNEEATKAEQDPWQNADVDNAAFDERYPKMLSETVPAAAVGVLKKLGEKVGFVDAAGVGSVKDFWEYAHPMQVYYLVRFLGERGEEREEEEVEGWWRWLERRRVQQRNRGRRVRNTAEEERYEGVVKSIFVSFPREWWEFIEGKCPGFIASLKQLLEED
ncbi:hypothetical protein ABW19_dt0205749 [Dactylella cylindrospora]|nr:hypothetical protein ABW19_dt0205749 [Dactylella cylindrospora]